MSEEKVEVEVNENSLIPDTVTKYQTAADIANRALAKVVAASVAGAKVRDLTQLGDATILEGVKAVYAKKKDLAKGIAFPTCVSPNSIITCLSPIAQDAESIEPLKDGDVVRIELGAHIDGYAAMAAHTIVVGASKTSPIVGKKADLLTAAHTITEAALRLLKPGKTNYEVTDAIAKISAEYNVKPVQGMMSYQLLRNNVNSGSNLKRILLAPTDGQRKETKSVEFEEGDVFALDILLSTGEGVAKYNDTKRTTVFKKTERVFGLKTSSARATFSEIKKNFGDFPFAISNFEDETKAKLGLIEIEKQGLVEPFRVCYEKEGEDTVHIVLTVLLMPNGPLKITGPAWDSELVKSDIELKDEAIKDLLKQAVRKSNKKKSNK
ncbi:Proliferation-associated protein 2G4 [Physocladia obscura]|uniref:Proliferation-associated protein 2G4 n=1 Tax=Physocladia obscura TaxID=109957 RepID=A0AAD5XLC4_9FUNG|nr:Proliferation-associated protein 2G4 [Physocladia obscura]